MVCLDCKNTFCVKVCANICFSEASPPLLDYQQVTTHNHDNRVINTHLTVILRPVLYPAVVLLSRPSCELLAESGSIYAPLLGFILIQKKKIQCYVINSIIFCNVLINLLYCFLGYHSVALANQLISRSSYCKKYNQRVRNCNESKSKLGK